VPGNERPLTERGRDQAVELARMLASLEIEAVYSSPYRRAVETMEPIVPARDLPIHIMETLRERLLTSEVMSEEDRLRHSILSSQDPDYRAPGGESRREAEGRGVAAISEIRDRHEDGLVAVGSHAGLIRIILGSFDPRADLAFGLAMPMPAVHRRTHDGIGWKANLRGPNATRPERPGGSKLSRDSQ
jgi:2,3-bisphosphoglycerate-dependent phosphoglycerate mutase